MTFQLFNPPPPRTFVILNGCEGSHELWYDVGTKSQEILRAGALQNDGEFEGQNNAQTSRDSSHSLRMTCWDEWGLDDGKKGTHHPELFRVKNLNTSGKGFFTYVQDDASF